MPNVNEIWSFISTFAPPELAAEWDNIGPLVNGEDKVTGILVCLDITPAVVQEAVQQECNLVVSHHPVIFKPLGRFGKPDVAYQLARAGVSAVCAHTNLDAAEGGVNDVLANLLGLQQLEPFANQLGRVGNLPQQATVAQLAAYCGQVLSTATRFIDVERTVQRVAVVGGSGGDFWQEAQQAGAEVLITGEAKYNDELDAFYAGMPLIVAGHYATEWPVVPVLAQRLQARFDEAKVLISQSNSNIHNYMLPTAPAPTK